METCMEIRNLSIYYGTHCALKDINLKIEKNDFLAIIGPNGGGKSTLLKAILQLIPINQGEIIYRNQTRLGYVPQYSSFDRGFPISVEDAILSGRLGKKLVPFQRVKKKEQEQAQILMERFLLMNHRNRLVGELSGGQLQKVLIARALMSEPEILLLDEPTASLDAQSKTDIYEWLKDLNRERTILVVSHDLMAISPYIRNIACLNRTLHYHGKEEYLKEEALEKTYGCPVELLGHGEVPHRILHVHQEENHD